jgi:hypothetical protein
VFVAQCAPLLAAELLTNGSFELPAIVNIDQEYSAPSGAIIGWQLTERTVNINRTSAIFGTANSGDQMVDINGSDNGSLQQSFPRPSATPIFFRSIMRTIPIQVSPVRSTKRMSPYLALEHFTPTS